MSSIANTCAANTMPRTVATRAGDGSRSTCGAFSLTSGQRQRDAHVVADRVGVRAHLVRRVDELLRLLAVRHLRQSDDQLDLQPVTEHPLGGPDAHGRSD